MYCHYLGAKLIINLNNPKKISQIEQKKFNLADFSVLIKLQRYHRPAVSDLHKGFEEGQSDSPSPRVYDSIPVNMVKVSKCQCQKVSEQAIESYFLIYTSRMGILLKSVGCYHD